VVIQEVSSDLAESFGLDRPRGALITQVQPDGPAAKAGLQAADVILKFNGKPVENSGDLPRMVGTVKPGSTVPLEIWRKGKAKTVSVVLTELPSEEQLAGKSGKSYSRGGLALSELTLEQRQELKIDYGLLVEDATGDALRAGIRTGDVILAVNNGKVATVDAYRKAIAAVPSGKIVAILVRRGEGSLYIPLKISG
jgi:serine protease Do